MSDETPRASLRTNGWAERALLHCLVVTDGEEVRSRAAGMQDIHGRLKQIARKPDGEAPADESVYRTGNRAFHELRDKGLVRSVSKAENLGADRYDVPAGYTPDDGRRTEWVLTEAGFEEVRQLDAVYDRELAALRRRFGRWD
jgi:hypothetical protein